MKPTEAVFTNVNVKGEDLSHIAGCFRVFHPRYACRVFLCVAWLIYSPHVISQTVGTTVIVVASRDTIILEADSKRTAIATGVADYKACKIHKVDDSTFISSSGFADLSMGMTNARVDLLNLAGSIMRSIHADMFFRFGRTMDVLTSCYYTDPLVQNLSQGRPVFKAICIGRENDTLKIIGVSAFKDSVNGINTFYIRDTLLNPGVQSRSIVLGEAAKNEGIMAIQDATAESILRMPLVEKANAMMRLALRIDTTFTGCPIDILRLTRQGYNWIQRKESCGD